MKKFKKCISCHGYSSRQELCLICGKSVCLDCFAGGGMCTDCLILTKSHVLVENYFTEKYHNRLMEGRA